MTKRIVACKNIEEKISKAFETLAIPVGTTLGPGGRNVLLRGVASAPTITKDGVTVSNNINVEDDEADLIISIIKEAGDKTNREAGDGTTSATVLAHEIYKEGIKHIAAGYQPVKLQREIITGIQKLVKKLNTKANFIKEDNNKLDILKKIANISMNGEKEIANIVAEAVNDTGIDGSITVKPSSNANNTWKLEKGLRIDKGWISPSFKVDENADKIIFDNPYILITSHDLYNAAQLAAMEGFLNPLIQSRRPIVIISSGVGGEFMGNLVANVKTGRLQCCPIIPPYFGVVRREFFRDLAAFTGARVIDKDEGDELGAILVDHLGSADSVEITAKETVIVGGHGSPDKINGRKEYLRQKSIEFNDLDKVKERLAKLSGGVGVIELYCFSDVELQEKQFRIEDAAHACRAALKDGYIPGGGAALLRSAFKAVDHSIAGENIVYKACRNLVKLLASNANKPGEVVVDKILNSEDNTAINLRKEGVADALESGIIDPLKVVRTSLINGGSVAATLLTTGAIISDVAETNSPLQMY